MVLMEIGFVYVNWTCLENFFWECVYKISMVWLIDILKTRNRIVNESINSIKWLLLVNKTRKFEDRIIYLVLSFVLIVWTCLVGTDLLTGVSWVWFFGNFEKNFEIF